MSRWSASVEPRIYPSRKGDRFDFCIFRQISSCKPFHRRHLDHDCHPVVNPLYPYDGHICCMICKERLDLHVRFRIISQEATSILAKVGGALVWFGGWYQGVAIVSFLCNRIECLLALPSAFALCMTRDQFTNTTAPRDATSLTAGLLADSAG